MKPQKKIQKSLERRLNGHRALLAEVSRGKAMDYSKAYRAPGSRNPRKQG